MADGQPAGWVMIPPRPRASRHGPPAVAAGGRLWLARWRGDGDHAAMLPRSTGAFPRMSAQADTSAIVAGPE
jgi:hypothetical protein